MNFSEQDPKKEVMVTVREATPEDAYAINKVRHETWLATYPNEEYGITREDIEISDSDWDSEARLERRREGIATHTIRRTWVAEAEGKVIGFCIGEKGEKENRLKAIYVLPDEHKKGIGRRLVEQCFAWLGKEKDILVDVVSYNTPAIDFYIKKLGFKDPQPVPEDELFPLKHIDKKLPEIRMRKSFAR